MRLGRLIERLRAMPLDATVQFEAVGDDVIELGAHPSTGFHSYRGYYERLAFGSDVYAPTVGALLDAAKACVGKTFVGYKGGDFRMTERTPVHVADRGETSDNRIIGVRRSSTDPSVVFILIAHVEDW